MSVTVTRTRAEQGFAEAFEAAAAMLPGGEATAARRRAALGVFWALGLPHRRIEEWKYTDLRAAIRRALPPALGWPLELAAHDLATALGALAELDAVRLVFVDGAYRGELSSAAEAAAVGIEVASLRAELAADRAERLATLAAPGQDAVIALNTAFAGDGAVLRLPTGARLARPLLLVFARAGREPRLITTRNVLELGAGAAACVIEAHVALAGAAAGQANTLSAVSLADGSRLHHAKVTLEGAADTADGEAASAASRAASSAASRSGAGSKSLAREASTHLASTIVTLGARASYRVFQLTAATSLVRNHLSIAFAGEGGELDITAAFLGRGREHVDTTLVVDHAVPGCTSRELVKGVLAEEARGVFQGKVIVRPGAQKSDGKQMAQALLLSASAEFDSKPELEINADDVVCGHGSTAAEIDPDVLFYLRARGIPLAAARAMLIESFLGEALDKVEDAHLKGALAAIVTRRLAALTPAATGSTAEPLEPLWAAAEARP
jgi:Fe-S cluster assembly protein SufD